MRYRVWDKENKFFTPDHSRFFVGENNSLLITYLNQEMDPYDSYSPEGYKHMFVLQQSLEATDHNGKEVFEGDILILNEGLFLIVKSVRYAGFCFQQYTEELNQEEGQLVFLPYLRNWLVIGHCFEDCQIIKERADKII